MSTATAPSSPRRLHAWTRDLHLYAGLFVSPFLLLFAFSTLALNHRAPAAPGVKDAPRSGTVALDPALAVKSVRQARIVMEQLGVTGEIDNIIHNEKAGRLTIPVSKPGELTRIEVDLGTGQATIQRETSGLSAALAYLHKRPGPHLVALRGNWPFMAAWSWFADATVAATLFLTVSGLYLWWFFRSERTVGWLLLFAGLGTAGGLIAAIVLA